MAILDPLTCHLPSAKNTLFTSFVVVAHVYNVILDCLPPPPGTKHGIELARSINLTRFTFLDPGSLFLRNKSYWIHKGPSKSGSSFVLRHWTMPVPHLQYTSLYRLFCNRYTLHIHAILRCCTFTHWLRYLQQTNKKAPSEHSTTPWCERARVQSMIPWFLQKYPLCICDPKQQKVHLVYSFFKLDFLHHLTEDLTSFPIISNP